jgi:hypothetical protein
MGRYVVMLQGVPARAVTDPLMPKGVEHGSGNRAAARASGCDRSVDAERR